MDTNRNNADVPQLDLLDRGDITTHRYRFWHLFRKGFVLENHFALPGSLSAATADEFARAAWAESVKRFVGGPIPPALAENGKRFRFTEAMAMVAVHNGTFAVKRPGEA